MRRFEVTAVLVSALFLAAVVAVLMSPLFEVTKVTVTGNSRITTDEILEIAGLDKPGNIFAFSGSKLKRDLKSNSYVQKVNINVDYFTKEVLIDVEERILSGYVEYMNGTYLFIDDDGRVLEANTSFVEKLPVVVGLDFTGFTVGEVLDVKNISSFDTVVTLAHIFNKYEMGSDVIRVDVSDPLNTRLFVKNLDVELGRVQDADEKIRTMKTIIETLPEVMQDEDVKGFLDLKDTTKPARFKSLT